MASYSHFDAVNYREHANVLTKQATSLKHNSIFKSSRTEQTDGYVRLWTMARKQQEKEEEERNVT